MNELLEITKILGDEYVSNRSKWEITAATKEDGCWLLTVKKISEDKGAENESN